MTEQQHDIRADEAIAPAPPKVDLTVISIPCTITRLTYESVKKYLVPPGVKIFFLTIIALEVLVNLWGIIVEHSYLSAFLLVVMGGLMAWLYLRMPSSTVKNVLKNHKELRENGFRLLITFGRDIHLMNHTTGVERTMNYKDIYSMA